MATQEGRSPTGGMIGKSPIERDMNMAETEEASAIAGEVWGKTTCVTFMAASNQWERNKNGKRLRSEILESSSAPGDWRSQKERMMRQQAREMAQLHQMVDKTAKLLEAFAACKEMQWLGLRKWMKDRERKWDSCQKDDVLWGTGISDMAAKILVGTRACEIVPVAKTGLQSIKTCRHNPVRARMKMRPSAGAAAACRTTAGAHQQKVKLVSENRPHTRILLNIIHK